MTNTKNNKPLSNIVISGAGLSGLFLAKLIRFKGYDNPITIVEKSNFAGGQFNSYKDKNLGLLDFGMHVYYDSCIDEIDSLIQSVVPDSEWNIYHGNYKDIAGIYFNGKLQKSIPYPDLSNYPKNKIVEYLGEFMLEIKTNNKKEFASALDYYINQFGSKITEEIIEPIMVKLHGKKLAELDPICSKITNTDRVALFSKNIMVDLSKSDLLRSKLAFPDQLAFPKLREKNQRALYPKKFGFKNLIDKLQFELENFGVKFLFQSIIDNINYNTKVNSISIKNLNNNESANIENIDTLYWSSGMPSIANLLNINLDGGVPDKRPKSYFIYFFLVSPPQMGELYYFYCYDEGFNTFRITNYSAYCDQANTGKGFPICIEYWPKEDLSKDDLLKSATKEILDMKVINEESQIINSLIINGGAPPIPSIKNFNSINSLRKSIEDKNILNLVLTGLLASKDTFFIPEVLTDAYNKFIKYSKI